MSTPPSNPPSTRSTPAPRGRPAPRAGYTRKSKAERERYAAEQAERDKARSSTPSAPVTPARGGRGGARGGRGGLNREGSHQKGDGTGFSVFGGNVGAAKSRNKDHHQGREEWLAGGPRTKEDVEAAAAAQTGSKATGTGDSAGGEGGTFKGVSLSLPQQFIVPEDDEVQVDRRDIERIWISSDEEDMDVDDDEDDVIAAKGKRRADASKPIRTKSAAGAGLRPVRAPRARVETDDLEDEDLKGKRALRRPKRDGASAASAQVIIDDPDSMDVDEAPKDSNVQPLKSPPSSPELKKKALAAGRRPHVARAKSSAGHQETQEERAERLRVIEDTSRLLDVFTPHDHKALQGAKGKSKELEEGRLFLLQFPPITPLLFDPTASTGVEGDDDDDDIRVKNEHDTSASAAQQQQQQKGTAAGKTHSQPTAPAASTGLLTADSLTRLPPGYVGKLNVHASGKISLDWAGTAMEVKLGTEVDFLQDAVLLEPNEKPAAGQDGAAEGQVDGAADEDGANAANNAKGEKGPGGGNAFALGQVQGKLVVTPAWGRIFD